MRTQNTAA